MKSTETRAAVMRAILRHENEIFQTFQIREELGWDEESAEARRLHAIVQSLKQEGVIAQTGTKRKRNQYLMLKDATQLRLRLGRIRAKSDNGASRAGAGAGPSAGSSVSTKLGPQRVLLLEERVGDLEQRLTDKDAKLDEILNALADVKVQISDLHREWVS